MRRWRLELISLAAFALVAAVLVPVGAVKAAGVASVVGAEVPSPASAVIAVGSGPAGVAISPDGTFAYVVNDHANTVSRIRTADDTVTVTIPVGNLPLQVAISPDGRFAYVGNVGANTVSRIRTADDTVTATIPVGTSPQGVAISPDATFAYVANRDSHTVSRIRTADDRVVATISVGVRSFPVGVAISPQGGFAYVTAVSVGSEAVFRIRTGDDTVTSTMDVGLPAGVAIAPNGTFAYVTNKVHGTVSRIRTSDGAVTATVGVGQTPVAVAISPDSSTALVTNNTSASVTRINTVTDTSAATFTGETRPYGVAFAPSGTYAYVTNYSTDTVWRVQAPDPPPTPSPVPGSGTATVNVTAAPAGAGATSLTVTSMPDGRTCTVAPPAGSCEVTGLRNGVGYTFSVTATNAFGVSVPSPASAPVTPMAMPGPPTLTSVIPGDRAAQVVFTPPAETGGAPITAYQYSTDDGGNWVQPSPAVTASPVTIPGLTNGTTYQVRVRALTTFGPGAPSSSGAVTPRTVPGPPTGAVAEAGNRAARVSWRAPVTNGGSPVTGYTVIAAPGGQTCTTSGALTCTVGGLPIRTVHTFRVTATNVAGTGLASPPSNPVTPTTVPTPPRSVHAVGRFESATVTWTAPADNGGSPITAYTVTATPSGRTCTSAGLSCQVLGLTGGTSYTFRVTAANAAGMSPASAPSAAAWVLFQSRPPVLRGWPAQVTSWRGRPVAFAAQFQNMPGTQITGVTLVAATGGRVVASAATVTLPPGTYRLTQYVGYTMSNGQSGVEAYSQLVRVVRYDPPPPVTYEFYGVNNYTYWTVIRRQGASMRATFYGDGPGFCFAGTRLPGSREYQGYARVYGEKRAFVRTHTSWERGAYWVRFYTVGDGRYFSYVAGRPTTPPWYVGKLRRVVDTCSTW